MADHESNSPSEGSPQLRDLRPKIRALLPQNMQARVLGGIALLMTLLIMFSGRQSHPAAKARVPTAAGQVSDPNLARIQEYRAGIDAATRQLAAEEAQLAQTKQTLAQSTDPTPTVRGTIAAEPSSGRSVLSEPEVSRPDLESAKREKQSFFASNIALSYRFAPAAAAAKDALSDAGDAPPNASRLSETKQGMYRLLEGTILETVLTNRLDSSFSGPVDCMVTTNVYSPDRTMLVIPQGTRVLGEVRKLESLGEQRLAVTFHRLIRPDGYSVSLDKFQGLSQIGETGLVDQINHHYVEIFGAAIAIGSIAGLAQANTAYGVDESASDAYRQGVASSLSQSSMHILDRYLNVLPTFTIREGHRVKVYLSQDLSLPAYDPETELSKE